MNKEVYIARVVESPDGWYAIDFPDLPGTHAQCKDLSSVQKEAENALCAFLADAKLLGIPVSKPSSSIPLKTVKWRLL